MADRRDRGRYAKGDVTLPPNTEAPRKGVVHQLSAHLSGAGKTEQKPKRINRGKG